mmetsp:Transcript_42621/g.127927  ORF Transcript_42621/g.127927 Transcript_42621/m.127927 type:complete len:104 (+) Transcript_42621:374-685(+)
MVQVFGTWSGGQSRALDACPSSPIWGSQGNNTVAYAFVVFLLVAKTDLQTYDGRSQIKHACFCMYVRMEVEHTSMRGKDFLTAPHPHRSAVWIRRLLFCQPVP